MDTHNERGYRGGSAGPIAAIVAIIIALAVLGWLELGLVETLLHGVG